MRNAVLAMEARVALQAEHPAFPPHQHEVIGAAMGIVTDHAPFHPHGGMLVNVGSALFHVALDAGLPVSGIQAGAIDAAVRVVTIRTLDKSLWHAMVHRQCKFRLDIAMAGEAQTGLGFLQQTGVQPSRCFGKLGRLEEDCLGVRDAAWARRLDLVHQVRGVALITRDGRRRVLRVGECLLLVAGNVARHAAFGVFFGAGVKREDQPGCCYFLGVIARRVPFGIRMSFTGTVAGFASGYTGGRHIGCALRCARHNLGRSVRGLCKRLRFGRMAARTGLGARIVAGLPREGTRDATDAPWLASGILCAKAAPAKAVSEKTSAKSTSAGGSLLLL